MTIDKLTNKLIRGTAIVALSASSLVYTGCEGNGVYLNIGNTKIGIVTGNDKNPSKNHAKGGPKDKNKSKTTHSSNNKRNSSTTNEISPRYVAVDPASREQIARDAAQKVLRAMNRDELYSLERGRFISVNNRMMRYDGYCGENNNSSFRFSYVDNGRMQGMSIGYSSMPNNFMLMNQFSDMGGRWAGYPQRYISYGPNVTYDMVAPQIRPWR